MLESIKKAAGRRCNVIEGQIRGLGQMINNEAYCVDIMIQNLAVQKSLASLNKLILENHLRTHIRDNFKARDPKKIGLAVDELLNLYELNNIRSK